MENHVNFEVKDTQGREHGVLVKVEGNILSFQDTLDGKVYGKISKFEISSKEQFKKKTRQVLWMKLRRWTHGVVESRTDRRTRCVREIWEAEDRDSGKYEVVCVTHGYLVGVDNLAIAKSCSTLDFCEKCRG